MRQILRMTNLNLLIDKSVDEIIILLNRNDDKCSVSEDAHSNTKENIINENISFSEEQIFTKKMRILRLNLLSGGHKTTTQ